MSKLTGPTQTTVNNNTMPPNFLENAKQMPSTSNSPVDDGDTKEFEEALRVLENGLQVRRIRGRGHLGPLSWIFLDDHQKLRYNGHTFDSLSRCTMRGGSKSVDISEMVEVRQGYSTDGLHEAAKSPKFQEDVPHPKSVYKSIDFAARGDQQKRLLWVEALNRVLARQARKSSITFDECVWLREHFRHSDLNRNGEIEFAELWKLLSRLGNLQLSEVYVGLLFKEVLSQRRAKTKAAGLSESEFFRLFELLTDLPEYRNAVRLASTAYNPEGQPEDSLTVTGLLRFLVDEQKFKNLDSKKVGAIIEVYEKIDRYRNSNLLSVNGFRRLLQSRWGNILREGHENVFQDMDKPLPCYFVKSSHNTYLTGLQVKGSATVEGYIAALQRGNRLLELDVFNGPNGEPTITHKRTFISSISLRNALTCIRQYAFQLNPYPVILTIENHAGVAQQKVMAELFVSILGDMLYMPGEGAGKKPLPSPNQLKNKVLLRGKMSNTEIESPTSPISPTSPTAACSISVDDENGENGVEPGLDAKKRPLPAVEPSFAKLIALPGVKLSKNLYDDMKNHPTNASASLSESKVLTYLEAAAPIATYSALRFMKSYPKGLRQDSSNMRPTPSWLCGIQSVAMNCQTHDENADLVNGFFSINGNVGYVLKPQILLDGIDPRTKSEKPQTILQIAILCGNYLPRRGKDVIDPYVTVETFGIPDDSFKFKTHIVRNNGFNPAWNENFTIPLHCPEMVVMRIVVKDHDTTSINDFIGEYSIPVSSIRPGYSHIRLNTGFHHTTDEAASLFVRVAFDEGI